MDKLSFTLFMVGFVAALITEPGTVFGWAIIVMFVGVGLAISDIYTRISS